MKNLLSVAILFFVAVGCGLSNRNRSQLQAIPSPTIETVSKSASKLIDIPRLAGKSQQEVKKVLGKPVAVDKLNPTDTTGEISYDYKLDNASAFINFKNGKANYFHFHSNNEYETVFELADLVGANLRGVVPVSSNPAQITYSGNIGGYTFEEVRASVDGRYSIITFRVQ